MFLYLKFMIIFLNYRANLTHFNELKIKKFSIIDIEKY